MERDGDLITRKELQSLHQAGRRKGNIEAVEKFYGDECVSCGSHEDLEYHHIVPLYVGGSNRPTNIVPLCRQCHYAVHYGVRLDQSKLKKVSGGRPHTLPSNEMIQTFDDYLYCRIPKSIASKRLGVKRIDTSTCRWMRDELDKRKIIKFKNLLEVRLINGGRNEVIKGECIGWHLVREDNKDIKKFIFAERFMSAEEFGLHKRMPSAVQNDSEWISSFQW